LKKITAILFLLILLFNAGGYRIAMSLLEHRADKKLEAKIDERDYDESQLIEIRVALNMPYQERYSDFERQYGEIEMNGKMYSYVKRKIEGDVVIFKCIPNEAKQELKQTQGALAKANSASDMEHNGKSSPVKSLLKTMLGDYEQQTALQSVVPFNDVLTHFTAHTYNIPAVSPEAAYQPPEC
jgi:hypothetical protein